MSARVLKGARTLPCSRSGLLLTYYSLILKSFFQHRIKSTEGNTTTLLGYTVAYSTLPILINLYEEIFIEGAYYFETKAPRPVILDCGSNIGISVLYFKMLYPDSVITAFEPDAISFSMLNTNVKVNGLQKVTLINEALGNEKREQLLYTPEKNASLNTTLLPIDNPAATTSVKVNCLSSFIDGAVDCVKLDIEGSEVDVLEDLIRSKKIDMVRCLLIEFHDDQVDIPRDAFIKRIENAELMMAIRKESAKESLMACIVRNRSTPGRD